MGPFRTRLLAKDGRFENSPTCSSSCPASELSADGEGTQEKVSLAARLRAQDLSRLTRTFAGMQAVSLPTLSGSGALDVDVNGSLSHPAVKARGGFGSAGRGACG